MERQTAVVDASVLHKWFVKEEDSDEALALKNAVVSGHLHIVAPDVVLLEIMNSLWYKGRKGEEIVRALTFLRKSLYVLPMEAALAERTLQAASAYTLSMYDAAYVGAADVVNCKLITADKKLSKTPRGQLL
jgi:predicted nucleic acid-binding protein